MRCARAVRRHGPHPRRCRPGRRRRSSLPHLDRNGASLHRAHFDVQPLEVSHSPLDPVVPHCPERCDRSLYPEQLIPSEPISFQTVIEGIEKLSSPRGTDVLGNLKSVLETESLLPRARRWLRNLAWSVYASTSHHAETVPETKLEHSLRISGIRRRIGQEHSCNHHTAAHKCVHRTLNCEDVRIYRCSCGTHRARCPGFLTPCPRHLPLSVSEQFRRRGAVAVRGVSGGLQTAEL